MWKNFLLSFLSFVLALVLFEGAYYFVARWQQHPLQEEKRKLFFRAASGPIFQNYRDILFYTPNQQVRIAGIYYNRTNLFHEIDYSLQTNNFGLVQDDNLIVGVPTLLLVGDSYTEGFGAEPWFRHYQRDFKSQIKEPWQLANGGILGTGFQQFWKLENYLTQKNIEVKKMVVIFISDDLRRIVFNLDSKVLACINGVRACDGSEGWIRFEDDDEIPNWVQKLRTSDELEFSKRAYQYDHVFAYQLAYKAVEVRLHPVQSFSLLEQSIQQSPYKEAIIGSKASISAMVKKYGNENLIFVHIPQKEEILDQNRPTVLGVMAKEYIQSLGAHYFDGFKECNLNKRDYFIHDSHPNSIGYKKVSDCVFRATMAIIH